LEVEYLSHGWLLEQDRPYDVLKGTSIMPQEETWVDYYELMQISPNAEPGTIQRVFRMLAARYHPDNPQTGDVDRFLLLNRAYSTLMDSALRAEYDSEHEARRALPIGVFSQKEFTIGIDGESNRRMGVLCLLYNRRRSDPERPGVSVLELETMMSFPREHLLFTVWYLKEKDLIRQSENSDFVITSVGADYVEERLPSHTALYKLLKAAESGSARGGQEGT
jgi:curved DNA-binding protein CbpA